MRADHTMDCQDIRKRFKNFFEDLLSDEEYEVFTSHLDQCETCRQFVRSLGDLSNQIWKLGNVKIPSDMADTALFKLRHSKSPGPGSQNQGQKRSIPVLFIVLAIVGGMILLIQGITLLPKSPKEMPAKLKAVTPPPEILETQGLGRSTNPGYSSFRAPISDEKIPDEKIMEKAERLQPSATPDKMSLGGLTSESASMGGAAGSSISKKKPPTIGLTTPSFHLHGVYSEDPAIIKLQEKKRLLQAELVSYARQAAQMKVAAEQLNRAAEPDLQDIEEAVGKLERSSLLFKEENQRIDSQLISAAEDREAKQLRHRQKITEALRVSGVTLENQPTDVLVFSGGGDVMGRALQGLYPLFTGVGSIQDFTPKQKIDAYERQAVSLYIEKRGEPSSLHWHLAGDKEQQATFFEILKELGGSRVYENGKFSVCLVPKKELSTLKAKIQALRLEITEYGSEPPEGTVLTTTPARVSVFFLEG